MIHRSRLTKTIEKNTQKRLILSLMGIVLTVFLLVRFGIPALINFSLFLANFKSGGTTANTGSQQVLLTPTLNQTFTATNSATIILSGSATPKSTVEIYINDSLTNTTQAKDDGTFVFSGIMLTKDQNTIRVKSKNNTSESNFSDPMTIAYINKSPSLSVDNPHDGQSFGKDTQTVIVSGKTDPNIRVTVNGFWAVTDSSGNFSYSLHLQPGDNQIQVIASDVAGNTAEKDIKVHEDQ